LKEYKIKQQMKKNNIKQLVYLIRRNGYTYKFLPQQEFIEEEIELHKHDSNQERRGQKGDIWDGGHRVPLIISWPAKILQAGEYDHLVSLTDLFATFSDLTRQEAVITQGEDSFSFWHVLNGDLTTPTRSSMVHHSSRGLYGIRSGAWKYIEGLGSGGFTDPVFEQAQNDGPTGQLYQIDSDTGELKNLYLNHRDKVDELQKMMQDIKSQKLKGEGSYKLK
jgi:arylsulfatase A-like enzyme